MTRNWNDMPNEVKFMIVDKMDIVTRVKLKMCSKSDKTIVESVPCRVEGLVAVYSWLGVDNLKIGTFRHQFVQQSNNKNREIKLSSKLRKYTPDHLIKKCFNNLLLKGNLHMNNFITDLDCSKKLENVKIDTKKMMVMSKDALKWVKLASSKTKNISIDQPSQPGEDSVMEGLGLIPGIINADVSRITGRTDINDEQLLTFKFKEGYVDQTQTTVHGIANFIKKIIANDYPTSTWVDIGTTNDIGDSVFDHFHHEVNFVDGETNVKQVRIEMTAEKEVVLFYHYDNECYSICVQKVGSTVGSHQEMFNALFP